MKSLFKTSFIALIAMLTVGLTGCDQNKEVLKEPQAKEFTMLLSDAQQLVKMSKGEIVTINGKKALKFAVSIPVYEARLQKLRSSRTSDVFPPTVTGKVVMTVVHPNSTDYVCDLFFPDGGTATIIFKDSVSGEDYWYIPL